MRPGLDAPLGPKKASGPWNSFTSRKHSARKQEIYVLCWWCPWDVRLRDFFTPRRDAAGVGLSAAMAEASCFPSIDSRSPNLQPASVAPLGPVASQAEAAEDILLGSKKSRPKTKASLRSCCWCCCFASWHRMQKCKAWWATDGKRWCSWALRLKMSAACMLLIFLGTDCDRPPVLQASIAMWSSSRNKGSSLHSTFNLALPALALRYYHNSININFTTTTTTTTTTTMIFPKIITILSCLL